MGDEARLCPAGAVAVAEHDHRQFMVAHEAGDAVVDGGHGKQRAGAFLRLHAAGGDEAHHRQALLGAGHEQLAELLRAGHVEGAGLEAGVGYHGAHALAVRAVVEGADAGHHTAGRRLTAERRVHGKAESRELAWVGAHEVSKQLFEIAEEPLDEVFRPHPAPLQAAQRVLDEDVSIRDGELVPEILSAADAPRQDAPVVAPSFPLRPQPRGHEPLEEERHHHEQGVRDLRERALLPFLHGAEEVPSATGAGDAQEPIEEGPPQLVGGTALGCGLRPSRHRLEGAVEQLGQRGIRERPRTPRFFGHGDEVRQHMVVDGVEQHEVLTFGGEVFAQIVFKQNVEDGEVAERDRSAGLLRRFHVRGESIAQDDPVGHDGRGGAGHGGATLLGEAGACHQIVQGAVREGEVQFRGQLFAHIRLRLLAQPLVRQELLALVGEALPQHRAAQGVLRHGDGQPVSVIDLGGLQERPCVFRVGEIAAQGAEVVRRVRLPAVVEVHAHGA